MLNNITDVQLTFVLLSIIINIKLNFKLINTYYNLYYFEYHHNISILCRIYIIRG